MISLSLIGLGVLAILILSIMALRRIVRTDEVHVVQKAKKTLVYGTTAENNLGNTYYEFPSWCPILGVTVTKLPTAVFGLDLNDYDAYDKDRLPFLVDIKAFFRITDFRLASSRVTNIMELKEQLLSIVQGAARSILAKEDLENIMCERNVYGDKFTKEVAEQLKEWGVKAVKNIELMDIRDSHGSEVIANIMKKKKSQIEMESRTTVANNLQKAKEAEILANQEVALKEQDAHRQVGLRQAEVQQEVGMANEKAKQEVQAQVKLTTEKEMEVEKVRAVQTAEIEKQANIVTAQGQKQVVSINVEASIAKAEGDKQVVILNAEANKTQLERKAEADLTIAQNGAKGIQATGEAKAMAEKLAQSASVQAQIDLAKEIGENEGYQNFLLKQKEIEANAQIGIEQAKNLSGADIKIFANSGSVTDGVNQARGIFNAKNSFDVASALEAFISTPIGAEIADKLLGTGDAVKTVETVKNVIKKKKDKE